MSYLSVDKYRKWTSFDGVELKTNKQTKNADLKAGDYVLFTVLTEDLNPVHPPR